MKMSRLDSCKSIEGLRKRIEEIKSELEEFELDPDNYVDQYDEMLRYTTEGAEGGEIKIGNLCYDPVYVLKEVDPTAYHCGLNDYVDSLDKDEDPEYKRLQDELEDVQWELEGLEEEFESINSQEDEEEDRDDR